MKVLITPIGIYVGRVMKGIATIKPDLIYLCVQKPVKETKTDYKRNVYIKWMNMTRN